MEHPSKASFSGTRRGFLQGTIAAGTAVITAPALSAAREVTTPRTSFEPKPFEFEEVTVDALQQGMQSGKHTARTITEAYLERINDVDKGGPKVNSVIEVNPDALEIADSLDKERKEKGARGPLHGIPFLVKDNLDTADKMLTTAGSLALVDCPRPQKDSFVVQKLRAAGAVILGKTNLSEWANIRSGHSTSGWSGRGGLTHNPYALDRNPCGSSSGTGAGISSNLAVAGIGTETDGSIVCPSSSNGLVGIKPTVGLVSRSGIIPISHSQDGAGPMCRTVRDAAIVLGAITGVDPTDRYTLESQGKSYTDYTRFLDPKGLKGARIGVVRKYFGFSNAVDGLMNEALDIMKREGAVLIDPAELESFGKFDDSEFTVFLYELKNDLPQYLATRGPNCPMKNLKDLIEFNEHNAQKEMPYFGQETFEKAEAKGPLTEREYIDALETNHRLARAEGIDGAMNKYKLDALVAPTGSPASVTDLINGDHFGGGSSNAAAVAGYPNINVTAGHLFGLPVGISFFGRAWSEPTLIKLAYSFEQASQARKPPKFLPTVEFK